MTPTWLEVPELGLVLAASDAVVALERLRDATCRKRARWGEGKCKRGWRSPRIMCV